MLAEQPVRRLISDTMPRCFSNQILRSSSSSAVMRWFKCEPYAPTLPLEGIYSQYLLYRLAVKR